jgi:hypothetical protein
VIVELMTLLTMLAGGTALLHLLGSRGWGLPFLGFAAGVALYICVGFVQAMTFLPTTPILTLLVTLLVPVTAWAVTMVRVPARRPRLPGALVLAAASVVATCGVGFFARWANLAAWSPDSFRYLMVSSLLAQNQYGVASPGLVAKRILGVPLLHAPAGLDGEFYLTSITPAIAVAVLGSLAWFAWTALRETVPKPILIPSIVVGVALLASVNRFVFHAFYVNGHMLFGMLLLVLAGSCWLLIRGERPERPALQVLILLALPALVVTRAEGSLVVVLAMLPLLLSERVTFRFTATALLMIGLSAAVWQLRVIGAYLGSGVEVPFSAFALLAYGILVIAAIPVLRWSLLRRRAGRVLWLVLAAMWGSLAVLSIRDPDALVTNVRSTVRNLALGDGSWGLSAVLIAGIVAVLIVLVTFVGDRQLSFVLTSFVPLALLLGFLRGGVYRVGDGDSLNRMVISFVPVAVLFIVAAVAEGALRRWRTRPDGAGPVPSSE